MFLSPVCMLILLSYILIDNLDLLCKSGLVLQFSRIESPKVQIAVPFARARAMGEVGPSSIYVLPEKVSVG